MTLLIRNEGESLPSFRGRATQEMNRLGAHHLWKEMMVVRDQVEAAEAEQRDVDEAEFRAASAALQEKLDALYQETFGHSISEPGPGVVAELRIVGHQNSEFVHRLMEGRALEALEGQRFFVFGCDPKATDTSRHTLKTRDLMHWVRHLMIEEGDDFVFVVADRPLDLNIYPVLLRKEKQKPISERRSDDEVFEEAQDRARLIGIRDLLFLETLQEHLLSSFEGSGYQDYMEMQDGLSIFPEIDRPDLKRRPVTLMSTMSDPDKRFPELREKLEKLVLSDREFLLKLLETVPHCVFSSVLKKSKRRVMKNLDKYIANGKILGVLGYPIFQLIFTWLNKGIKNGHVGERPYDELAIYVHENYGEILGIADLDTPRFNYPFVQSRGENPYRTAPLSADPGEVDPLSARQGFMKNHDFMGAMRELQLQIFPIYERYIDKIRECGLLGPGQKEKMVREEAYKMMGEMVLELAEHPALEVVLRLSGILDIVEGDGDLSVFESDYSPVGIPYTHNCERGESVEGSFIRYVCQVLQGIRGPASMIDGMTNDLGFMFWEIGEKLYKKVEGKSFVNDFREWEEGHWDIDFADYVHVWSSAMMPVYLNKEDIEPFMLLCKLIEGTEYEKILKRSFDLQRYRIEIGARSCVPTMYPEVAHLSEENKYDFEGLSEADPLIAEGIQLIFSEARWILSSDFKRYFLESMKRAGLISA